MTQVIEIAKAKSKTRESSTNGISMPDQAASARLPEIANIQPKAAPPATRRKLSVSVCRKRRPRPAPRAMRNENSRARVALRATRVSAKRTPSCEKLRGVAMLRHDATYKADMDKVATTDPGAGA